MSILAIGLIMTLLLTAVVSAAFGGSRPAGGGGSSSSGGSAATGGGGGGGTGGRTPTCVSGYVVKDGACVKEGVKKVESEVPAIPSVPVETPTETTPLLEEVVPPLVAASVPVTPTTPQRARALAGRAMAFGQVLGESLTTMAWLWITVLIVIIAGIIALRIHRNKA